MSTAMRLQPPTQYDTLPPHDLNAEQALVGSFYLAARGHADVLARIVEKADERDFMLPEHAMMVRAIRDVYESGTAVDEITLPAHLARRGMLEDVGGRSYLIACINATPSVAGGPHYAAVVRYHADLRRIAQGTGDINRRAYEPGYGEEDLPLELAKQLRELSDVITSRASSNSVTFAEAVEQTMDELENGGVACVATGFRDLDRAFGGLGFGETIIVAARPSMGKSLLSRQLGVHIALQGRAVGLVAAEESRQKVVRNALSWYSGFPNKRIRLGRERGQFSTSDWAIIRKQADRLKELPIHVADKVWDLDQVCALGAAWKARHDIAVMIVDHIGLIRTPSKTPYERASAVSTGLKHLYKHLNVVGVSVAQINRSNTHRDEDHRPRLSDLRDSGRIEEDADGVILLHREDYYHRTEPDYMPTHIGELIFAKWRDGDTSEIVKLRTKLSTQHFEDMEEDIPSF